MEEPSRPVITNRTRRYVSKPNSLRYLCGGRLHKWLALFLPSRERGWTPWPGWPASRLILAQYVPESCSSPSTDRVTMDTIIRAWPLSVARWRRLWRKKDWPDFRKRCEAAAFPWTTPSKRSRSLRARCGAPGTEKLQASRVSSAHLEFFASVDEIALAKRELIEGLNGRESTAVLNADDARVAAFGAVAPGRVLTYGVEHPAFFMAEQIEDRGALGTSFDYVSPEGRVRVELSLPGRHVISNALGALAAASVWGIGAAEAQAVLRALRPPSMRGELLRFSDGAALINDSYNSSPAALQAMTQLLVATPGFRRRILAAGEMRELGPASPELHREAGRFAASTGKIDWIFGVEGDGAQILEGAVAAGFERARTKFFASSEEAAAFLTSFFSPGDLLLVKGSRGVKMEKIVERLLAHHGAAREEVRH